MCFLNCWWSNNYNVTTLHADGPRNKHGIGLWTERKASERDRVCGPPCVITVTEMKGSSRVKTR